MWLDYDDKYAVSEDGYVMYKKNGNIISASLRKGYARAHLSGNKWKDVHCMIAERFLPKIDIEGLTVDHIDRDITNNNASNLRWADRSTQMINRLFPAGESGHRNIRFQASGGNPCVRIMRNGKTIFNKTFETLEEAITARDNFLRSIVDAQD